MLDDLDPVRLDGFTGQRDRRDQARQDGAATSGQGHREKLPLLASKLAPAPMPDPVVERPRLLARLDTGTEGPVTLLSAPAGWGKTTLLNAWFRARSERTPGWLSVEPGDHGARFWAYLDAALRTTGVGPDTPPPPDDQPDHEYLTHLAATLARHPNPVTLLIDDLHRVDDPAVLGGLDFLVRHADQRLRLVIGSRAEPAPPLHRMRLTGELTVIAAEELSFTEAEAAELLAEHGVALPDELTGRLHARTEGWPVGLRLAALSLPGNPDPTRFVDEFGGDHPAVAGYLTEEVLAELPVDVRDTLARASIAPRLTGALVDALTGRRDGADLLAAAQRATGFVVAFGTRPRTYRCHRMLGDLLYAELHRQAPEQVRDLHASAARWYAGADSPAQALRHALAAGDWGHAVEVVDGNWLELLALRHLDVPAAAYLPPPTDQVRRDPRLAVACAVDRLLVGDLPAAGDYLRQAAGREHRLDGERRLLALMVAAGRLAHARRTGDQPGATAAARQVLTLVPPARDAERGSAGHPSPTDAGARVLARTALGAAGLARGDLAAAEAELADGLDQADRAGLAHLVRACAARLALVHALRGGLRAAERTARTALAAPSCGGGRPPDDGHAYLALALVSAQRDQPDDAEANLALAAGTASPPGRERGFGADAVGGPAEEPVLVALVALTRAQLRHDRGDLTGSYRALHAGRQVVDRCGCRWLAQEFTAAEARLSVTRGDAEHARELLRPVLDTAAQPAAALAVALADADLRAGDPRSAARVLPPWDGVPGESWPLPVRLEAGLLDAVTARLLGDQRRATRTLERVLQLAEPDGHRRIFVRAHPAVRDLLLAHLDSGTAHWPLVTELVATADGSRPAPPVGVVEPLTERELTVLRYLQSILSNVEIASELSLSVNTVKTHVRNIYRKLDATRRRDAVRRARELRLL